MYMKVLRRVIRNQSMLIETFPSVSIKMSYIFTLKRGRTDKSLAYKRYTTI